MQRLRDLWEQRRYDEFREELVHAEIAGQISEFYSLSFQASLAMVSGSEFARDYLEMAELVARSPAERAVSAETRAAYELRQGNPLAAAERCLAALEYVCHTEGLWGKLLIALSRLGEGESIDMALRGFARLGDECSAQLVGMLDSEPMLGDVRARPAWSALLSYRYVDS